MLRMATWHVKVSLPKQSLIFLPEKRGPEADRMRASEAAFRIQGYKEALASFWLSDDAFFRKDALLSVFQKDGET